MKIKKAVITAAGFGSRFLPFVKNIPKEMLPVVDKPSIQYLVEECEEAGIEQIYIIVREWHSLFEDYFFKPADNVRALLEMQGKMDRFADVENVLSMRNIKFIQQDARLPYGNGSPVLSAKPVIEPGESFALLFGDDMVLTKEHGALKQLVDFYEQHDYEGVTAVQKVPYKDLDRYAIVKPKDYNVAEGYGQVESQIEKPNPENAPSDLASYGRMILPYRVFDYLVANATGKDNELWLQDANDRVAQTGRYGFKVIDGKWMTTGDPGRYLKVQLEYYLANSKLNKFTKEIITDVYNEIQAEETAQTDQTVQPAQPQS